MPSHQENELIAQALVALEQLWIITLGEHRFFRAAELVKMRRFLLEWRDGEAQE